MEANSKKTSDDLALERTQLAYERTLLASDRTLMAWVRTSLSLTSFGFTFYKFFQELKPVEELEHHRTFFTPRIVGMLLIALGFLGMLFALIDYKADLKRFKEMEYINKKPFTPVFASAIMILAVLLFLAVLFRQ